MSGFTCTVPTRLLKASSGCVFIADADRFVGMNKISCGWYRPSGKLLTIQFCFALGAA